MPLPLLPQLPPGKGEEPSPVCGGAPQRDGAAVGGPGLLSQPGRATLALSQPQCQGGTSPSRLDWECGKGKVGWCPRSAAGDPLLPPVGPGGTEECGMHSEFPLSIPRNGCSPLPLPPLSQRSRKTPPEQGLGALTPLQGPCGVRHPKLSWHSSQLLPGPSLSTATLGSADPWDQPRGLWGSSVLR